MAVGEDEIFLALDLVERDLAFGVQGGMGGVGCEADVAGGFVG